MDQFEVARRILGCPIDNIMSCVSGCSEECYGHVDIADIAAALVEFRRSGLIVDKDGAGPSLPSVHKLKTWPQSFEPMWKGLKTAEFRRNDQRFREGDLLLFYEYRPDGNVGYTGRLLIAKVTHIVHGPYFDIPDGYCVMSVRGCLRGCDEFIDK